MIRRDVAIALATLTVAIWMMATATLSMYRESQEPPVLTLRQWQQFIGLRD